MKHCGKFARGGIGVAMFLLLAAQAAHADVNEAAFLFEASNDEGSGTLRVSYKDGTWDEQKQKFSWDLAQPLTLVNPQTGVPIATLTNATLRLYQGDRPRIVLEFGVKAGSSTTSFVATPGRVRFNLPDGYHAEAGARAAVAVVDRNDDGVTLQALGKPGSGVFRAQYNGFVPNGQDFDALIGSISAGPGGSGSVSQNDPSSGFRTIGSDVTDMSCQVRFSLTPEDTAESSSRYSIQFHSPGPTP